MTAKVGPFTIPATELQTCYNSAAISGAMVASAAIATVIARDAMGNMDPTTATFIVVVPYMTVRFVQRLIPKTCGVGMYFGMAVGMAIPLLSGLTPVSYAVGSVAATVASGYITAATAHVVP